MSYVIDQAKKRDDLRSMARQIGAVIKDYPELLEYDDPGGEYRNAQVALEMAAETLSEISHLEREEREPDDG